MYQFYSLQILVVAETNEGVNNIISKLLDLGMCKEDIVRAGSEEKTKVEHESMLLEKRCNMDGKRKKGKQSFFKLMAKSKKVVRQCKVNSVMFHIISISCVCECF